MEVFPGQWTSFDHLPILPNNYNNCLIDQQQQSSKNTQQQDAEWSGFLRSIEPEHAVAGSEFELPDCKPNGLPDAMATPGFRPYPMHTSSDCSGGFPALSPQQCATQAMSPWQISTAPMMTYPPTSIPDGAWAQHQPTHQHSFHDSLAQGGLCIQIPTPPQTAALHHRSNLDQMFYEGPAQAHFDEIMHGDDDLSEHSAMQPNFLDDTFGTDGDDEADAADPCYAQLLYRCLMEAPEHTLTLKELYEWIAQHSQKAKDPKSRGWQNSVRHNLSMNAAFEKATGNGTKKGSLWRLTDHAMRDGVISTTRYRKDPKRKHERKGLPALKRQISGARGGQATRAATRRIKEMHQARSSPYTSAAEHHRRHRHRGGYDSGFISPMSVHSPQPNMLSSGPASPYFFPLEEEYPMQQPSNLHTPPQLQLRYDAPPPKPALEKFELQHIDFHNGGGLFGDTDNMPPETPSLATDASFMSDDGMQSLLSPAMSREQTIF
ncbi:hypothetical protein LTR37_013050 [Vermiconidia calcicola]|uniref:Uncharacterized protein n=1 Tax=Vermiconidia calcicola TaxID=1690605 RepID=A0ACC3MZ35_9PEZI|nr:hypothetical protein LTR37_013050 [Vermiconidia calcicola]